MLENTLTCVLAGGIGSRLAPLTAERAKPAVPFGGKYRIVDFALSNCLHSGLRRILVLTQYKSHSLHKHLRDGWSVFNPELGEYVTAVPAQMRTDESWYRGTADALYQNRYLLERSGAEHVLVLSADHIYRMDYAAMLADHRAAGADLTVACMEVPRTEGPAFGVLSVNDQNRVVSFQEKPTQPEPLPDSPEQCLASMGIYVFSTRLLLDTLVSDHERGDSSHDFGKDILPRLLADHAVHAYRFGGDTGRVLPDRYWRDVGTIDAYYQANMDLLQSVPPLNLYQADWPIRSYQPQTPPARTVSGESGTEGIFINSILAGGAVIAGGSVQRSILFPGVYVEDEAFVEDSILFDDVSVGRGAQLRNCIVDKRVTVPANARIGFDGEEDAKRFHRSPEGIIVVPKGYRFED